ncbi:MAG: sigma-70 family RNA polymerase sigma factor [Oscillospiraceae bacterium]|nr:sigma-70 family RNA polymerase sigma factor [Oscillospiraceae bacterium]
MEDAKIIALFFARNEQAIVETDTAYGRKLYNLSNNILNNPEDAEESVSDTYMETWKSIPPKHPKYFYAFLASICRNLSFNRLDWHLAAKRKAEVVALTREMEMCIPDARQEGELDRQELRRVLEAFLDSLTRESRLIFLRRYLYVDTVAEIAVRYGISESKVKTQLHRTRAKLHTWLAKEGISL